MDVSAEMVDEVGCVGGYRGEQRESFCSVVFTKHHPHGPVVAVGVAGGCWIEMFGLIGVNGKGTSGEKEQCDDRELGCMAHGGIT